MEEVVEVVEVVEVEGTTMVIVAPPEVAMTGWRTGGGGVLVVVVTSESMKANRSSTRSFSLLLTAIFFRSKRSTMAPWESSSMAVKTLCLCQVNCC